MARVFQIVNDICFYDATRVHRDLASTVGKYPPDVLFVEAPDYVREGWGYDAAKEGDERFIMPTAPKGWEYDMETGTFYELAKFNENQRERNYRCRTVTEEGEFLIPWDNRALTVDQANDLWFKYMAEGSTKADELTALIAAAKAYIRELYPVEE